MFVKLCKVTYKSTTKVWFLPKDPGNRHQTHLCQVIAAVVWRLHTGWWSPTPSSHPSPVRDSSPVRDPSPKNSIQIMGRRRGVESSGAFEKFLPHQPPRSADPIPPGPARRKVLDGTRRPDDPSPDGGCQSPSDASLGLVAGKVDTDHGWRRGVEASSRRVVLKSFFSCPRGSGHHMSTWITT